MKCKEKLCDSLIMSSIETSLNLTFGSKNVRTEWSVRRSGGFNPPLLQVLFIQVCSVKNKLVYVFVPGTKSQLSTATYRSAQAQI